MKRRTSAGCNGVPHMATIVVHEFVLEKMRRRMNERDEMWSCEHVLFPTPLNIRIRLHDEHVRQNTKHETHIRRIRTAALPHAGRECAIENVNVSNATICVQSWAFNGREFDGLLHWSVKRFSVLRRVRYTLKIIYNATKQHHNTNNICLFA